MLAGPSPVERLEATAGGAADREASDEVSSRAEELRMQPESGAAAQTKIIARRGQRILIAHED
jgi:hypothetical protein